MAAAAYPDGGGNYDGDGGLSGRDSDGSGAADQGRTMTVERAPTTFTRALGGDRPADATATATTRRIPEVVPDAADAVRRAVATVGRARGHVHGAGVTVRGLARDAIDRGAAQDLADVATAAAGMAAAAGLLPLPVAAAVAAAAGGVAAAAGGASIGGVAEGALGGGGRILAGSLGFGRGNGGEGGGLPGAAIGGFTTAAGSGAGKPGGVGGVVGGVLGGVGGGVGGAPAAAAGGLAAAASGANVSGGRLGGAIGEGGGAWEGVPDATVGDPEAVFGGAVAGGHSGGRHSGDGGGQGGDGGGHGGSNDGSGGVGADSGPAQKPPWGWDYLLQFPTGEAAAGATGDSHPPSAGAAEAASMAQTAATVYRARTVAALVAAGFAVSQAPHPPSRSVLVRLALPAAALDAAAPGAGVVVRLRRRYGGGAIPFDPTRPWAYRRPSAALGAAAPLAVADSYWSPAARAQITASALRAAGVAPDRAVASGQLLAATPLHDPPVAAALVRAAVTDRLWRGPLRATPINELRAYLGSRPAIYFAFASTAGRGFWAAAVVATPLLIVESRIRDRPATIAALHLAAASALVAWAVGVLEGWKRRVARLRYRWGIADAQALRGDDVRPGFRGRVRPGFYCEGGFVGLRDVVNDAKRQLKDEQDSTGRDGRGSGITDGDDDDKDITSEAGRVRQSGGGRDRRHSGGRRRWGHRRQPTGGIPPSVPLNPYRERSSATRVVLLSASITVFVTLVVGTCAFLLAFYRASIAAGLGGSAVAKFIPGIAQGTLIAVSDPLWRVAAAALTRLENHRTVQGFQDALVFKRFVFMVVTNFATVFYLAFVRPLLGTNVVGGGCERGWVVEAVDGGRGRAVPGSCLVQLRTQLLSTAITKATLQQLAEVALPWALRAIQRVRARRRGEGAVSRYVAELQLPALEAAVSVEDYAEQVIQYAYVALFGLAAPAVALIAAVNATVETRSDAFKLLTLHRRPEVDDSTGGGGDIGAWSTVLQALALVAVPANLAVVLLTNDGLAPLLFRDAYSSPPAPLSGADGASASVVSLPRTPALTAVVVAIAAEHLLLCMRLAVGAAVRDTPRWTARATARRRYDAWRWHVGGAPEAAFLSGAAGQMDLAAPRRGGEEGNEEGEETVTREGGRVVDEEDWRACVDVADALSDVEGDDGEGRRVTAQGSAMEEPDVEARGGLYSRTSGRKARGGEPT
ncbi:hypothetical protein MMPV_008844 [Pyropia vietnamensis]